MSFFKRFWATLKKDEAVTPTTARSGTTPAAGAAPQPVERRTRKRLNARKGARALIIDDSPTVVAALRKILRSAGYLTTEAPDAEQGLERVVQEKPDLIFLDIILPGMNGFAALRVIRKDPLTEHIPVIMISGNERATEQFYGNRIGADDFMKKPFSRHEVFARIESLLDANRMPRRRPDIPGDPATPPEPAVSVPAPAPEATPPSTLPALQQASSEPSPARNSRSISAMEARKELTAMGLQYFDQKQFVAAIRREDVLAVQLFVIGGGVQLNAAEDGKLPLELALDCGGSRRIAQFLQKHGARQSAHLAAPQAARPTATE